MRLMQAGPSAYQRANGHCTLKCLLRGHFAPRARAREGRGGVAPWAQRKEWNGCVDARCLGAGVMRMRAESGKGDVVLSLGHAAGDLR